MKQLDVEIQNLKIKFTKGKALDIPPNSTSKYCPLRNSALKENIMDTINMNNFGQPMTYRSTGSRASRLNPGIGSTLSAGKGNGVPTKVNHRYANI